MRKNILIMLFLVVFIILVSNIFGKGWLIYHDGPYRGRVIDANTDEPIEGAVIAGLWSLHFLPSPHLEKYCDAQEGKTNENGEFYVPIAFCYHFWPLSKFKNPRFVVFKPGYLSYPPRRFSESTFSGNEFRSNKQYQIIKLNRANTKEERISAKSLVDIFRENKIMKKTPYLLKLVNVERNYLGFKGTIKPSD